MCTVDQPAVVAFRELAAAGSTARLVKQDVASGKLVRVRRGVYLRAGACPPVASAGAHGGSLACVSAAAHLGLWVLRQDDSVHVWVRAHGRSYPHGDCHCTPHWDDGSTTDVFGMPSVPRILRQIALCRGLEAFFVTLESARRMGLIDAAGLTWLRQAVGPAAREAVDFSRHDADSGLESLFRWRLRRYGLSVRTQIKVTSVGRVDFLIGERLIVEVDGVPNHDDESHRHKDLVRDANAAAWGYLTLRFDYALVVHDWATVEGAVLAYIDRGLHLAR
ncbi:type IV toxin-antitoxin system AbiEi family antitoxin domain-containing protein [Microbacterium kyungheense]|uniref:Very-short-patch-repair endonuclease n=1 Tax=Microbacterium kyungheense TaxID=1263636 RepID=A0A543F0U3_9MICO|nr:type IV toxin-antitoxin system AbiEi family antitoxin domain-containing protein [Microbacterium kyungheense]TQM27452.1 very-short-patch-repair endonuclease [Microbacterium kyungheense]